MHHVLRQHAPEVAGAMRGMSDCLGNLALIRDCAGAESIAKTDPAAARLHGQLDKACAALTTAAAAVPMELWAIMLNEEHVGANEIMSRFGSLLKEAAA